MADNRTTLDFLGEALQSLDQAQAGLKSEQSEFYDDSKSVYKSLSDLYSNYEKELWERDAEKSSKEAEPTWPEGRQ